LNRSKVLRSVRFDGHFLIHIETAEGLLMQNDCNLILYLTTKCVLQISGGGESHGYPSSL